MLTFIAELIFNVLTRVAESEWSPAPGSLLESELESKIYRSVNQSWSEKVRLVHFIG